MDKQDEIKRIDSLILKYLEGAATKDEKAELYQWVTQSEENELHFKEIQELWLSAEALLAPQEDTQKALQRFHAKINRQSRSKITIFRKYIYYISQTAAILIILFGVYYFFTQDMLSRNEQFSCVEMTSGNKGCITLPDSTIVWLNSDSKLTYPDRFSDRKRVVELYGQAYFQVAREEQRPFIVESNDMDIEVLGTSFTIKNYSQDENIAVALIEGSLKIKFPKSSISPIILQPSEQVVYSRTTQKAQIFKQSDSSLFHIWAQNRLLLSNCPLTEVLEKLSAWYNEKIILTDTPDLYDSIYVTLTVREESLIEILQTLKTIAPIDYRSTNDTIFISYKQENL